MSIEMNDAASVPVGQLGTTLTSNVNAHSYYYNNWIDYCPIGELLLMPALQLYHRQVSSERELLLQHIPRYLV